MASPLNNKQELVESVSKTLEYAGLTNFIASAESDVVNRRLNLFVHKKFDITYDKDLFESSCKFSTELFNGIEHSPLVKYVKRPLEDEIEKHKKTIEELNQKIEKLREFETYYNMQFKLTHGKEHP